MHTVTMGLSTVEPLVMSVLVLQNSNISSPIDAVSLIGSDNGTQSPSVASPSLTTTLNNDLLIGFSKVSAGATFFAGRGFTLQPRGIFQLPRRRNQPPPPLPGSYDATFTLSAGQNWEALIAAEWATIRTKRHCRGRLRWRSVGPSPTTWWNVASGPGCNNFAQIGTTTGTTFNDIGLTGGTVYNYRVRAQDTANNDGPYSNVATVTTPHSGPVVTLGARKSHHVQAPSSWLPKALPIPRSAQPTRQRRLNSTGGDLIVLCADSLAGVTFTPTDNFGNSYSPIAGPTSTTTGSDLRTQLWYVQNPIVGPGHTITMGLSSGQPLVMSVIVVKGSNISSAIDVVSLIGSDNGTQTTNVVSSSITTSGFNDLLIGFAKVSAGATFLSGPTFTEPAASSSNFLDAGDWPCGDAGNLRCDVPPRLKPKLAVGGRGRGQQSESNHAILDAISRTRRNRDRSNHQQLLSGAVSDRRRMHLCSDWHNLRHHLHRYGRYGLCQATATGYAPRIPRMRFSPYSNIASGHHPRSDLATPKISLRRRPPVRRSIWHGRQPRKQVELSATTWYSAAW